MVGVWLEQLGLRKLAGNFACENIEGASLALLSHSQLQELGVVRMGDRIKLLRRGVLQCVAV